jgi:IS30 family transposase
MYFNQVGWPTETRLCARTIYNYVKQGVFLNVSIVDLPRKGSKPKRRKRRIEKRLHPSEYKRIDERQEKDISEREVKTLERFINHYPRKILDGPSAIGFRQAAA